MERNALSNVVNLVEVSGLIDLAGVLENRVTEKCLPIFNVNGTYRKVLKSKMFAKLSYTLIDVPPNYTGLVDMGMIWRMAIPTTEYKVKNNGTSLHVGRPHRQSNHHHPGKAPLV